ncbi:MAG: hypothetical protein WD334_10100 [Chitinophagales bacterium]
MGKYWFLLIFLILAIFEVSAIDDFVFRDSSGTPLLHVSSTNTVVKNNSGRILYSFKQNEVFKGIEAKRRFILLRIQGEDIFAEQWSEINSRNKREKLYYTYDGGYYFQPIEATKEVLLLAYWRKNNLGGYSLFHGQNDTLLAYYEDGNANSIVLSTLFHHLQLRHSMKDSLTRDFLKYPDNVPDVSNTSGSIWSMSDINIEYIWDGYTLIPQWKDQGKIYTFDGYLFKWGDDEKVTSGYVWENNILKWRWGNSLNEFIWNGKTIKRLHGPNPEEFRISKNKVEAIDNRYKDKWVIEGEIPVPVIAMVIYILAYR